MAAGYKKATVTSARVPSTQTNFPSYVDLSRLGITTLAEAQSVRVYVAGNECAREIVSATEMHVKIPSLTSTTTIYVEWDGVRSDYAVDATYGRNAVWSGYAAVYHMADTVDSTGNGKTLTDTTVTRDTQKIGDGGDYGTSSRSITGSPISTATTNLSIQMWFNPDTLSGYRGLFQLGTNVQFVWCHTNGTALLFTKNNVAEYNPSIALSTSTWAMIHYVKEGDSTNNLKVYKDATAGTSCSVGTIQAATGYSIINQRIESTYGFGSDAKYDEIRVRDSALSANWITTEYNNQNDEADFWGTWTDAVTTTKTATVNSSKVAATLSNYPTYIDLTRVKGSAMTQAEADSVRIYTDSAKTTEIAREIVSVSECHAKIPSLTTTTQLWVDYDGSRSDYAATDTYGRNAVWSGYAGVWHLEESSGTRVDSGGSNNLTDNNTVTSVAGQIGNSADFLGTNSEYLSGTRIGHIEGVPISYTFWVNLPSTSQKGVFIEDSGNGGINNGFAIGVGTGTLDTNANRLIIPFWGVSWQDTTVNIGTGWHMITLIIGSDRKATAYLDGTSVYTGTAVMGVFANSPFLIGRSNYSVAYRYLSDGSMDEVRVIDSALSADWITTEYNNQSDEASFWGTWTDAGGAVANNGFMLWWA